MASVAATIALNIVSNFATDVLKWAAGESISPISEAIRSTGALFPEIDGVEDTLKQWLVHTRVTDVLNDYIAGQVGANELPLRDLVSILLEKTQFYLPEHSRATAEKIVGIFLTKLRTTYFADLQTGILHLANRGEAYASQQQAQLTAVQQQMQQLTDELKTASGLKPSLQKHFEAAAVALDRGDYPTAKALFESLLTEVEIAPQRDLDLQRRVEVNLGKIASGLGDHVGAVAYYKRAAKIDTDRVRAAVNESVADLLGLRPQDALERLNKLRVPMFPCPTNSGQLKSTHYWGWASSTRHSTLQVRSTLRARRRKGSSYSVTFIETPESWMRLKAIFATRFAWTVRGRK